MNSRQQQEQELREHLMLAIDCLQKLYGLSEAHAVTYSFTGRHKEKGIEVLKQHNIQFMCKAMGAPANNPRNQNVIDTNIITFGEFAARKLKQEHKEKR